MFEATLRVQTVDTAADQLCFGSGSSMDELRSLVLEK
jgi:hypothetical protein